MSTAMVVSQQLTDAYRALQREADGYVLLMQVGAFMQVMDEGARQVSAITGLKLQMAGAVDDPVVLGGFPKSGIDQYVGKLVRAGHSVAIAWQGDDKQRRIAERIGCPRYQARRLGKNPLREAAPGATCQSLGLGNQGPMTLAARP
ncbi:hypothetical protein [uncultured Thiodictyon sp.]|uniref:hypothetical protein n=1 Tax=uncultured Thiodictyon sp. TaxID=1846217 RepID=UPI0025F65B5A|nr:hypothetical protein [uncultured Thiodictyon sp.]